MRIKLTGSWDCRNMLQILWEAIQNSVVFHLSGDGLFYINCEVHAYSCLIGAGGRTYTPQARLWHQCTGQHPSLPYMQAAISSECGSVSDLQFWCSDHISDALVIVSWIQVPKRMEYKIAVWAYAVIHGAAPWHLEPFTNFADVSSRHTLQSTTAVHAVVLSFKLSTIGSRASPDAATEM